MEGSKFRSSEVDILVGKIIAELFQTEMKIFGKIGSQVLDFAAVGLDPREELSASSDGHRAEFGLSETLQIVNFVSVALGTYKAYLEIKKITQAERRIIDTAARWKQTLTEAGLAPENAQRIVDQFGKELSRL